MNVADIIILSIVGVCLVAAFFFAIKRRGRCCDCDRCQNECRKKKDD